MRRIIRSLNDGSYEVVRPPGRYGDGPAYVRVCRERAGENWPHRFGGLAVRRGLPGQDGGFDYVFADHTLSAFAYLAALRRAGLPADGLTVVTLAAGERRQHVQRRTLGGPG